MSLSIQIPGAELTQQISSVPPQTPSNDTLFESMYDMESYEDLKEVCEKSVENIRQIIINLGETLKNNRYTLLRLEDVYATPQRVIESNITTLNEVQKEITKRKLALKNEDVRYFCNSYFTVKDVKDWGYRVLDYLSAAVALGLIVLGTTDDSNSQTAANQTEREVITKGSLTAILLIFSKGLSAVTDYRNKKKFEREVELSQLKDLSYKCKKAKEASAILKIMRSITSVEDPGHNMLLRRVCEQKIADLGDDNGGILDVTTVKSFKKQLMQEIDRKIKRQIMIRLPSIASQKDETSIIRKAFFAWRQLGAKMENGSTVTAAHHFQNDEASKTAPKIFSLNLPPLDYKASSVFAAQSNLKASLEPNFERRVEFTTGQEAV